ncbi:hypothetical protein BDM02DRAFT_3122422 [Thelephora ganbajun]|uniref:Uncharacterized protein n=1 Tax=Thelephora ganbajun TaxID=370292 RepID=A0ACB6Z412_THEGA|nr:hypothetical protein BDM02DRAFT_3122422 [Thelephora ganbajun]
MVWTLVGDSPTPNRVFTRPLDNNEVGFFYDGTFNGVADMVEHYMVQTTQNSLFEFTNVARTWIALKRIFPLLGAVTRETDYEATSASFTIVEANLGVTRPGEIDLLTANSEVEVHNFVEQLISGPRQLSSDLLSRVYIFSREDNPGSYHVAIHIAHLITDGMSALTLVRTFFDILSLPPTIHIPDLEARLALCVGSENLNPHSNLPLARRRWRRAIGWVIHHIRDPKIQGGMSIPRKITTYTPYRVPRPKRLTTAFTEEESTLVIANCRKHGITFGAALPILGQLGSSRLLHRRYIRGGIEKNEWEWRRIQPCNTRGPLDYRRHLNKDWYADGGSEVVALGISYLFITHPFMPSVSDEWIAHNRHALEDGSPPFPALLSQGRFVLRSNTIKHQFKKLLTHPLLFEIASARLPTGQPLRKQAGRFWRKIHQGGELDEPEEHVPSVLTDNIIYHNGGSSMGNYYPQTKADEDFAAEPTIRVIDSWEKLCARPTELYLGSITQDKKLSIFVSWDGNTYEDSVVEEWLEEVKLATHHYLCQPL